MSRNKSLKRRTSKIGIEFELHNYVHEHRTRYFSQESLPFIDEGRRNQIGKPQKSKKFMHNSGGDE